ncbi:MAG: hypothetical protein WBM00_02785 [Solirubrobacterales bacterium]
MNRPKLLTIVVFLAACASVVATVASSAIAARVRYGTLVVTSDGGFRPNALPRQTYAPIDFWGYANIRTTTGSPPPALKSAVVEFDRDGKLTTAGLSICQPGSIENATPPQARQRCQAAIVGTGHITAKVTLPGSAPVSVRSPLTLFNGPRQGGNPTVLAHAQSSFPATETYVVVAPIEAVHGAYSYRLTFDVPQIAGGYGTLTHADLRVGKRYRSGGVDRSYTSARCSDRILKTHGRFTFTEGIVISGDVFRVCNPLG